MGFEGLDFRFSEFSIAITFVQGCLVSVGIMDFRIGVIFQVGIEFNSLGFSVSGYWISG